MAALSYPNAPLGTHRIRLRPWVEADIPAIVAACQDPLMARFIPAIPSPYAEDDARGWLALHEQTRQEARGLEFAVVDTEDRVLGSIAFRAFPATRSASVGYWVAPEARGRGHATSALRLLCDWLFSARDVERIELTTDPANLSSQRVATRCGFRQEGYLRAHLRYRQTGARRDSVLWALLPDELAEAPEARPRIVWLNGTFGAGKSSAAAELKRRKPDLTVFNPEYVGFVLRETLPVPTGDFQDLPEWREVVASTGASLARHRSDPILAPMTVWQAAYLLEIFSLLRSRGVEVLHVLIDAPDEVLGARIDGDLDQPADAAAFRRTRLADYRGAREWLRLAADVLIDSAALSVSEVADRIEPLLG